MESIRKRIYALMIGMTVCTVILVVASCTHETSETELPAVIKPQIVMLYAPGGLGDQGYNDCVLSGVQQFKRHYHDQVDIYQYSPGTIEEASRLLSDWLNLPESNIPALFIVGSSDYEDLLRECLYSSTLTSNKRILFFESDNPSQLPVTTFRLSMFGASYLAGVTAAESLKDSGSDGNALILLAHPNDKVIAGAGRGFSDGFISSGNGLQPDIAYLADDWTGYIASQTAYQKMSEWADDYAFIFPVAGGSNQGIYRYTREYPEAPLTAGMDVDQSGLSRNITGSLIKHIDRLIYHYLETWVTTGELPASATYGLESEYTEWLLSPSYGKYQSLVESKRSEAISKERREI